MSNTPLATSSESFSCAAVPRELEYAPMAGVITRHELGCIPRLGYYLYVPASCGEGAPLMVAIHGISCNAKSQVRQFAALAERYGVILAAPRFTAAQFPAYQRLGVRRGAVCSRPDQALHALVEEVGMLTGARTDRLFLFGHSGGGQFVHRYAMAYPQKVQAVTMGAPGWYTFPDDRRRFPRGVATANAPQVGELCPEQFLQVPMAVFVGARDIYRDEALNTARCIDTQQGRNRLERGHRWIRAMRAAAGSRGYGTRFQFQQLEGCGHSFHECMLHGQMGQRVFEFLFGQFKGNDTGVPQRPEANSTSPFVMFQEG
jgi:pimeloyl-ACP methyl ester carboxylesterase